MNIQTRPPSIPDDDTARPRPYRLTFDDYKFLWDTYLHKIYGKTELLDGVIHGRPRSPADAVTRVHRIGMPDYIMLWEHSLKYKPFKTELIDGVIYEMPMDGPLMSRWNGAVNRWLQRSLDDSYAVKAEQTLVLAPGWAPDPDHYVFPAEIDEEDLEPANVLLLIEVSHTTLKMDLGDKAKAYAENGIREYWVIDPKDKRLYAHHLREDGTYGEPTQVGFTDTITAQHIPGLTLRMADLPRIS